MKYVLWWESILMGMYHIYANVLSDVGLVEMKSKTLFK